MSAFEIKSGRAIESIKSVIDMIRGKQPFDPYDAIAAALEIAEAILSVFKGSSAASKTCPPGTIADLIPSMVEEKEKCNEMLVLALASLLSPEEREEVGLRDYIPKFIFPTDMIVKAVLMWVLQELLSYGGEKLKEYLKRRREEKEKENASKDSHAKYC